MKLLRMWEREKWKGVLCFAIFRLVSFFCFFFFFLFIYCYFSAHSLVFLVLFVCVKKEGKGWNNSCSIISLHCDCKIIGNHVILICCVCLLMWVGWTRVVLRSMLRFIAVHILYTSSVLIIIVGLCLFCCCIVYCFVLFIPGACLDAESNGP